MKRLILTLLVATAVVGSAPTAQSLQTEEVLDVIAMPLAVAAVSEISGVPAGDLVQLITAMNDTEVAPARFVEIVRYSPVLLVDPTTGPEVVTFVTNEAARGATGDELVIALRERIRATGIEDFDVADQRRVVLDRRTVIPETVIRHVEQVRNHPHGGPPGQVKKELGLQTGAEVVHGTDRGEVRDRDRHEARRNDRGSERIDEKKGGPPPHAAAAKQKDKSDQSGGKAGGKAKGKDKDRGAQ